MIIEAAGAAAVIYIGSMGQSTAVGAQSITALTTTPPYPGQALMIGDKWGTRGPGVAAVSFQNTGGLGLAPALETTGPVPPLPATGGYAETHVTSMLAQQVFEGSRSTYVGRSDGAPGRSLAELMKGTVAYQNSVTDLTEAKALVADRGLTLIAPAVALIEGVSDRLIGTDRAAYCSNSEKLAEEWNADAPRITGQSMPIIFFEMQLAAPWAGVSAIQRGVGSPISQCQLDLGVSHRLFRLAAPSYMLTFTPGHSPHFDARSQRLMGEYLGKAMYQDQQRFRDWKPLYPTSIVFNSADRSKVEVTLHVPVGALVKDVTHLAQGASPNDGFTFHDECSSVHVVGDKIIGPARIEIQLSAPSVCPAPTLDYAYDYQATATIHPSSVSSAWGNIRDSDLSKGWAGDILYNWLVIFKEPISG